MLSVFDVQLTEKHVPNFVYFDLSLAGSKEHQSMLVIAHFISANKKRVQQKTATRDKRPRSLFCFLFTKDIMEKQQMIFRSYPAD